MRSPRSRSCCARRCPASGCAKFELNRLSRNAVLRFQLARQRFELVQRSGDQHEFCLRARKGASKRLTQTLRCAGDESVVSVEITRMI